MFKKQQYKKRTGALYRRWKGKDYSIDDPIAISNGTVWLKYDLHGKTTRKSLKTTDLKEAEQKRDSTMLPLQVADEAESLAQLELRARQAQQNLEDVTKSNKVDLSFSKAWATYTSPAYEPDCGTANLKRYKSHFDALIKGSWVRAPAGSPFLKDLQQCKSFFFIYLQKQPRRSPLFDNY